MDGIDDGFEFDLAVHFKPAMVFAGKRDLDQLYGEGPFCPDSDPECQNPFTVRRVSDNRYDLDCSGEYQCLEIMYRFVYNFDFGMELAPSILNPIDLLPSELVLMKHAGDGEGYAVLVARENPLANDPINYSTSWSDAKTSTSHWVRVLEYYRAHRCFITDESQILAVKGPLAKRKQLGKVYVAEGKHASYPSLDFGHFLQTKFYPPVIRFDYM